MEPFSKRSVPQTKAPKPRENILSVIRVKAMARSRCPCLSNRVFPLLFIFFVAAFATVVSSTADGRPGFLYTRSRGRCTPQFWSGEREEWPRMAPQSSLVSRIFGSRALERYDISLTLLQAMERNDDDDDVGGDNVFSSLMKQSAAALLNSYAREGFPYSAWEVKTLFIQALVSHRAAALQARKFSSVNEACT
ncbi:hypothetical protein Sjap_006276 [Stephania japonica]|uniref:Uncharacterized protein n=1 Tax=Stephania japonica TaxID=461633 RepID=A0AAP0K728_9MAGN